MESSEVIVDILALRLRSGFTGGHQSINNKKDLNCRLVTSELGEWGRGRGLLRLGRVREVSGIH